MSPETFRGIEHKPQTDDIFALGIIMFMMKTSLLPFSKSPVKDKMYRYITKERFGDFWTKVETKMEKKGLEIELEEEFKELF